MRKIVVAIGLTTTANAECSDLQDRCAQWAADGECDRNLGFMKLHACRASCASCGLHINDVSPIELVDVGFMIEQC